MSWFSEITSKAEAMLVKLDQNAAVALQNHEKILRGSKILDQALGSISNVETASDPISSVASFTRQDDREELYASVTVQNETIPDNSLNNNSNNDINTESDINSDQSRQLDHDRVHNYLEPSSSQSFTSDHTDFLSGLQNSDNDNRQDYGSNINTLQNPHDSSHLFEQSSALTSKKFTIQTSKSRARNFTPEKRADRRGNLSFSQSDRTNGIHSSELKSSLSPTSPGADDIRASINRSLQEYTLKTPQKILRNELSSNANSGQISHSSHFDNQPNLVQHTPLPYPDQDDDPKSNRVSSSPSLSIEVPDERSNISSLRNDIASRLLHQSALKKKSTFYLHKVINRLTYPSSQQNAIISDQMKIRFRRAQMRAVSYGRRLNYYFRTYPNLKYVVLIYLVLLQILVLYVLIFYQSNSSSSDLSTQIKQQQQEMVESRYE